MTPASFEAWRERQGLTETACAELLDCSRNSIRNWQSGKTKIKRVVALACAALSFGLEPLE